MTRDDLARNPWYEQAEGDAGGTLLETAAYLADKLKSQHMDLWQYLMIYSREDARNLGNPARNRPTDLMRPVLALNVAKAVIQTVQSQIVKGRVRPMFLTSGADWSKQRAVKRVDAFVQGAFFHSGADDVASELSLHAMICGTGIGKVSCAADGKPVVATVLPQEILFDPVEAARRNPRHLYHVRCVPRGDLLADPAYSDKHDAIKEAGCPELSPACASYKEALDDQVTVVEAWRLPSAHDAGDGRHVIACDAGTLLDEEWTRSRHPFIWLRWEQRIAGMLGTGIVQEIRAVQAEINRLLMVIQAQMMASGPKIFVQRGSVVNPAVLTNRLWDVVEYTGTEPKYSVFATVAPELFEQVDRLYQRAFDLVGVSTAASRGEKPAGVQSGVAIQTATDLQTGRMVGYGQAYEQMHVDLAIAFLDVAYDYCEREADAGDSDDGKAENAPTLTLTYPATGRGGRRYLGEVSAKDVTLARDEYVCEVWPTSKLASSPAARLDQVEQMAQAGWISPVEARMLLDFPDLQAANNLDHAPYDAVMDAIEAMLEDGDPRLPEPWTDLSVAVPLAAKALQRAQVDGVPERRWQLLANYLLAAKAQIDAQKAAAAGPPAPPAGAPGAGPGASGPPAPMPPPVPPGPGQ